MKILTWNTQFQVTKLRPPISAGLGIHEGASITVVVRVNVQDGGIRVVDVVRYRAQELAGVEPMYAGLVQAIRVS